MSYVSRPVRKKDAMALVTGKPVYTDDLAPKDCLIVKVLRSPHANAWIEEIKTGTARQVNGIATVYTYKDVPKKRFTLAGQTYPELSPYDHYILDRRLRFVGDAVAIVAGETEEAVDKALKRIKVKYQVDQPVLDMHKAKDADILVHPEEDWEAKIPVGADNKRNLCASGLEESGDVDKILGECKYTVDRTYHTKANQQAMMETFRTYCYMDYFGRLNVVSSTQIPFHVRRILGNALDIPSSKVRVIKPRIGGGFGAKQTSVCEIYPAFVTWMTGRPSKIIYSRYESQICASPRHEMEIRVRAGADENGIVRAIDVYTLSNAGAYGEHSPTTVGLSGHKSIALYRHTEAYRFAYDVVYTNVQAAGAYRGYGATQGIYAVESAVNELAEIMGMDPVKIRELNMPLQGEPLPAYGDCDTAESCTMDQCMERAKEMMNWDEKYPCKDLGNGKVRGVGVAMAMQGSSIAGIDVGGADMKLNEDGSYTLGLGCADMGTGCDTILAQMAADCMETSIDNIVVFGVDTDISPYDSGSYASATTYTTGMAVVQSCQELRGKICALGAKILQADPEEVNFDGEFVFTDEEHKVSLKDIAIQGTCGNSQELQVTRTYSSPVSPPPFMERAKEMMNWDEKYPCKDLGNGKVRGVGVAMAMQGSSIAGIDVGGADMKLNEDGSYTLGLGCADMGTGCDTILAQMAADCMETSIDNIVVFGVDTDISPYDSGSYASATTYTTGMAVVQSCQELRGKICALGAKILQADPEEVNFDGEFVFTDEEHKVSLKDIAIQGTCGNSQELQVTRTYSSPVSPPPFMVGMAEVEVDKETGSTKVIDYVAVVDCGTPINPNLVRVQTEGGIAQGIGMALYEDIQYNEKGAVRNNSFMQYKIPSRLDIGDIRVEIRGSYEPTGPFGAKSVGELVIDTPCPAIAAAVYNATGVRVRELPITPEKVAMGILQKESEK